MKKLLRNIFVYIVVGWSLLCIFIVFLPGLPTMFVLSLIMLFIYLIAKLIYVLGGKIGRNKARKEFVKETEKLIIENPYMYFRDIPNKYGIGVALSILNYKVGKDDVLAGILDLAAKGYIIFKQNDKSYEIIETLKDRSGLLKNELYLLDWILNKEIKKIQTKEWIRLAKEDAISLGLGIINEEKKVYKTAIDWNAKIEKKLLLIPFCITILLYIFICTVINISFKSVVVDLIIFIPLSFFIMAIIFIIFSLIYEGKFMGYNVKVANKLILNEIGKKEFHELYSLGKFLNDFGNFADKNIKEIVIWEQYLSYALMFGISDKILKTGYKELLINECFVINDLNRLDFEI